MARGQVQAQTDLQILPAAGDKARLCFVWVEWCSAIMLLRL